MVTSLVPLSLSMKVTAAVTLTGGGARGGGAWPRKPPMPQPVVVARSFRPSVVTHGFFGCLRVVHAGGCECHKQQQQQQAGTHGREGRGRGDRKAVGASHTGAEDLLEATCSCEELC